jgi:hypothetical protein
MTSISTAAEFHLQPSNSEAIQFQPLRAEQGGSLPSSGHEPVAAPVVRLSLDRRVIEGRRILAEDAREAPVSEAERDAVRNKWPD